MVKKKKKRVQVVVEHGNTRKSNTQSKEKKTQLLNFHAFGRGSRNEETTAEFCKSAKTFSRCCFEAFMLVLDVA